MTSRGKSRGWNWSKQPVKCELCGKEGRRDNIEGHIERNQALILDGEVAYLVPAVRKTSGTLTLIIFCLRNASALFSTLLI